MTTLVATTEIKEWGNSLAVRIPKKVKEVLGFHDGSRVSVSIQGKKVILESVEDPFSTSSNDTDLKKVLKKITTKNKHSLAEFHTTATGKEIW
jgi:antitoxin MazE